MKKLECPKLIEKIAKKEYKRIIKIKEENDEKIDEKHIVALERYSINYAKVVYYENRLFQDENSHLIYSKDGYPQQHPDFQFLRSAEEKMLQFAKELAITPASEARMNKNRILVVENKDDEEMEEMISK